MRRVEEGRREVLVNDGAGSHHLLELEVLHPGRVDAVQDRVLLDLKLIVEQTSIPIALDDWQLVALLFVGLDLHCLRKQPLSTRLTHKHLQ